jgi:hypothetical protein
MTDPLVHRAVSETTLEVVVVASEPLHYADGGSLAEDRPAHVRAGSALAFWRGALVVVQDDTSILALRRATGVVEPVLLPPGPGGLRVFDDQRGTKAHKLDLEACAVLPDERLVVFGSGSTPQRERIVTVSPAGTAAVREAAGFYAALRAEPGFAGAELNLEGAVVIGEILRLFQRGNGAPRGALAPVNATCDVPLDRFCAWLDRAADPPLVDNVQQYDLGERDGCRFGFTDATLCAGGEVAFLAAAEASPDVTRDGAVVGCRLGLLRPGRVVYTDIVDGNGAAIRTKLEGLVADPADASLLWAVADEDRADQPALLCQLRLRSVAPAR